MSAPDNTNTDLQKLQRALEAEREERKADKTRFSEFRKGIASRLGLADDAAQEAVLSALGESDTERIVTERTAALTRERDDHKARADKVESEWNTQRIDSELNAAFDKSGAMKEHREDFLSMARGLFAVDASGQVRTRADAAGTLPNVDAATWVMAELRAKRAFWWPKSVGGGAVGSRGSSNSGDLPGNHAVFDRSSREFSITAQGAYYKRWGAEATARAQARYRA